MIQAILSQQSALPLSRYDFWKDLRRLELLCGERLMTTGWTIALTNDPGYWKRGRSGTIDEAFRLDDGRAVKAGLRGP